MPNEWIPVAVDALAAVGTVGAFAIGFVLLRQEHQREEAREEEQRRLQAIKVSAWVEAHATAHGGRELLFHVHNASEMPIYRVRCPSMRCPCRCRMRAPTKLSSSASSHRGRPCSARRHGNGSRPTTHPSRSRLSSWTAADVSGPVMSKAFSLQPQM